MIDVLDDIQKQAYNEHLERTGYFCQICDQEQQNANGLITFHSKESVRSLNICHDCLPEGFE